MKCPRDGAELQRCVHEADVEVDRCPECEGIWLDPGEIERILAIREHDWSKLLAPTPDLVGDAYEMAQGRGEAIACPRCGGAMVEAEYAMSTQVAVDRCPAGCGLWLDHGEVDRLERFYEQHHERAGGTLAGLWAAVIASIRV